MSFLASLQPIDIAMLISIPSAIILGVGIFFLAGVHRVPKNHAIVIEKARQFYAIYDKGTHFKMPIAYQKVGVYCTLPIVRGYIATNGNHLKIAYQIEDIKKYHYNHIDFDDLMRMIEKENEEISLVTLQDNFTKYGLKFISINKFE